MLKTVVQNKPFRAVPLKGSSRFVPVLADAELRPASQSLVKQRNFV